ncbi:host cell division inhibitor Icd-like protein [Yersinia enterocolitica]
MYLYLCSDQPYSDENNPCYVTATDEQSARQRFVSDYVLCFAGRLPVYRGHHGTI